MFSKIEERNRISLVLFKFNKENLHLPRYKQECLPISRELSSFFLAGFKYAYDLMLKHKELILDSFNAYNFNAVTSRVLLHPTIIYTKSSRLFPLSYLFQKNQYKCDIVPSLSTGLCGIEPVEHTPV